MLLVCPNCSARYVLSSIALGEKGRDVRCAKCDHEWYEERDDIDDIALPEEIALINTEPVAEPKPEEESLDVPDSEELAREEDFSEDPIDEHLNEEPIPEGVKPQQEEEKINVPALPEEVLRPKTSLQAKLTGYIAALMVFGLLIAGGFIFKQKIVSAWLPAAAIYELAGAPVTFKGEQLVVESLSVKLQRDVDGQNFLLLEGRVINLTNEIQNVPKLLARLRSTNGEDADSWHIDTPLKKLEPGESFTFKSDYPAVPHGVGSVNLTFVPVVSL